MRKVLVTLRKAQLLYKPEKYKFYKKKVKFLGYIITLGGLFINPIKVNAILNQN